MSSDRKPKEEITTQANLHRRALETWPLRRITASVMFEIMAWRRSTESQED